MFYRSGVPDAATSVVGAALASVGHWVSQVLDIGRASGAVRTDLPVTLQIRLVIAVLRAVDEWSVANFASLAPDEVPALIAAQLAMFRRLLQ